MPYLDERSPLEMDYADSLSGILEALTYTILCLPIDASKVEKHAILLILDMCFYYFDQILYLIYYRTRSW